MTTVRGLDLRRIPSDKPGAGIPVFRLHYHADPSRTGEKLLKLRSSYTSDSRWRREMEVEYSAILRPNFNRGEVFLEEEWSQEGSGSAGRVIHSEG